MATDTADRRESHLRGLTVTMLACVAGIVAAVVSAGLAAGPPAEAAKDMIGLYVLVGAILVQFPLLRMVGIDIEEFSTKDYLYIAFMTFALWFVSWGVLLTANTAITF